MKPKEKPTASEILKVLDGVWIDTNGIMVIRYCGKSTATKEMKAISNIIKEKTGKELPRGLVPTNAVIDYYNINLNYLRKIAKEKE